jgi:transcriptional regulator with XRE-family HTH domain
MTISRLERKENIINNIEYLLKSRGESKTSFANRTGVTRAALYKILDGKVGNVQQSTITRIADFFGVSCEIIENSNLEKIEIIERTLSPEGDKNPAAIPVIPQSEIISNLESRIGHLVTRYPLTWYFGDISNMIALWVENNIGDIFLPGDMLIIKRKALPGNKQLALFFSKENGVYFRRNNEPIRLGYFHEDLLIGSIVEERIP